MINSAADVWAKVLLLMQADMTPVTIETWFSDATAVAIRLVPAPAGQPLVRKNSQTVETQDVG